MAKLRKVAEFKLKASALKDYPIITCGSCGEVTEVKTKYVSVMTEIDARETELIALHFEECDLSACCEEEIHLCKANGEYVFGNSAYTLTQFD
ncbi:hypothetical protein KW448_06930 [Vibrio fluvialis]|nr:hypothetical protein [Vibrio fluvialis]